MGWFYGRQIERQHEEAEKRKPFDPASPLIADADVRAGGASLQPGVFDSVGVALQYTLGALHETIPRLLGAPGFGTTPTSSTYQMSVSANFRFSILTSVSRLAPLATERHLPFPIFNATVARPSEHLHSPRSTGFLSEDAFEVTPLHYGSEALGYVRPQIPVSMSKAIGWSAAAADNAHWRYRTLAASVGLGIGEHVDLKYQSSSGRTRVLRVYLSDGGYTDNLGLFAPVKRLCRHIVVVDAEHDPRMEFEGYQKIRQVLRQEMRTEFSVPAIDHILGDPDRHRLLHHMKDPLFDGTVGPFPFEDARGTSTNVVLNVSYLKLSLNRDALKSDTAVDRYFRSASACDGKVVPATRSSCHTSRAYQFDGRNGVELSGCPFPQEETSCLKYSRLQFEAYRELGETLAARLCAAWRNNPPRAGLNVSCE